MKSNLRIGSRRAIDQKLRAGGTNSTRSPDTTRVTCELVANCKGMEGTEMKILAVTLISLSLFASVASHAQTSTTKAPTSSLIKIVRSDSLQSNKGSAQYFTGSVQVQQLFPANDPSRTSGGGASIAARVPGARRRPPGSAMLV